VRHGELRIPGDHDDLFDVVVVKNAARGLERLGFVDGSVFAGHDQQDDRVLLGVQQLQQFAEHPLGIPLRIQPARKATRTTSVRG
jgi:hypothetical protein